MNIRKVLDGRAIGLMICFCLILGMQQIAIKAATPDMFPRSANSDTFRHGRSYHRRISAHERIAASAR